jgi:hypothetical protein
LTLAHLSIGLCFRTNQRAADRAASVTTNMRAVQLQQSVENFASLPNLVRPLPFLPLPCTEFLLVVIDPFPHFFALSGDDAGDDVVPRRRRDPLPVPGTAAQRFG